MPRSKYTDKEMEALVGSMVVLVDTREKANTHITGYFDRAGIPYKVRGLPYGDYSFFIPANPDLGILKDLFFDNEVIVERKGSLEELSTNFTRGRDTIEKEFALAPPHKVLMVEASYDDLINGRYESKYNNKSFWATLHTMWHRYNLPSFFVNKKDAGIFIRGYLTYYLKEWLR